MARPDFGMARDEHVLGDRRIVVESKFVAPGLTMSDLVGIFEQATKSPEVDAFSDNPSLWPTHRGIAAVADAINTAYAELIEI